MTPRRLECPLRLVLPWIAIFAVAGVWGCTEAVIRPQSPDEIEIPQSEVPLVGDHALAWGTDAVPVEAVALVTGLNGTGSDPAPSANRARLLEELRTIGVRNPNTLLADSNTALVLVRGFLRPGIQKGDRFDVEVRLPSDSDATSLRGGWLMECRLTQLAVAGGGILEGFALATAQGPILVHPSATESNQPQLLRRGYVLGGGVAKESRPLHLVIHRDPSIALSKQIGRAINERFHAFAAGRKVVVATPRRHEFIDLTVHPRYRDNLARYVQVVRAVPIRETPDQRQRRLLSLEKQLLDPVTSGMAAIRLEAIGKAAAPTLRKGLSSPDFEVRFYAAEALAYLDDQAAVETLAAAARDEPAFRVYALTALGAMDDVLAYDKLVDLLDEQSAETRYGAFRALWSMRGQTDPAIRGEWLNKEFSFHELETQGPPMVHVTRGFRPEVVIFGKDQPVITPLLLEAGQEILIRDEGADQIAISRHSRNPGIGSRKLVVPATVRDLVRAVAEVGGTYPDVVQALQQAKDSGALVGRFEIDAVPKPGRTYERKASSQADSAVSAGTVSSPRPDLFERLDGEPDPSSAAPNEATTDDPRGRE